MTPPVALTIAGSDSGGGAGLQADLKTFAALGVFGASAVTAITAQNTREVRRAHVLPAELVVEQVETVLDDLPVAAVKTGMLADAAILAAVAALADAGRLPNLVVDPVMVASSGARLLSPEAEARYLDRLFPRARVVTPNPAEAEALLGAAIRSREDQREAARALAVYGAEVVVVTGGHGLDGDRGEAVDVVWDGARLSELRAPRVDTRNVHGSGCSFASAVAARLAGGAGPAAALADAKAFVHAAISGAARWRLGAGHGPLDHFGFDKEEATWHR